MTDNEIIKALECCVRGNCKGCPREKELDEACASIVKDALELLYRQQAEIERLNSLVDDHFWDFCSIAGCEGASNDCWKTCPDSHYNKIKNDAVKEFAETLKDKSLTKWDYHDAVDIEEIDNLVKEMVGDKK